MKRKKNLEIEFQTFLEGDEGEEDSGDEHDGCFPREGGRERPALVLLGVLGSEKAERDLLLTSLLRVARIAPGLTKNITSEKKSEKIG